MLWCSKGRASVLEFGRALPFLIRSLVAALPLFSAGCHKQAESSESPPIHVESNHVVVIPGSPPASSISLETAASPAPAVLTLNGRLVWDDNVTTRLFSPFAGRVIKIKVESGQPVQLGDPLALIASPDYGQAQADARRAATDLALAERTLSRTRELFNHGAAAEKDLQTAEADLERAKLEKQRTAERLALYGAAGDGVDQGYIFKAPIAGVVVEKNINPGAEIRSDQMLANTPQLAAPLFVITDPTRLWIQIDVPERDARSIQPGCSFVVRSASLPGQSFTGRVDVISDSLDPATRTIKARGSLSNSEHLLKAEMFVKADFVLAPERGTEISSRAVFLRLDKHCVLVEDTPGHYTRREVNVGSERAGRIIISEGLSLGQRVVVEGALLLEQVLEEGS
jgi:cobalt-zinc-cadmium efflux system membrane fusion protein